MTAHQPRRRNWFRTGSLVVFAGVEVYSVPDRDTGSALFGLHVRRLVEQLQRYLIAEPLSEHCHQP